MKWTTRMVGILPVTGVALCALVFATAAFSQTSPSAHTTGYRYSTGGLLTGVIEPYSGVGTVSYLATRNTYNSAGLLEIVERGALAAWQSENAVPAAWANFTVFEVETYTYDSMGRLKLQQSSASGVTYALNQYSYDGMGRPECGAIRMNPDAFGTAPGACTVGAQGDYGPDRITRTTYDAQNRPLTITRAYGTPLQQDYKTYTYTLNGLPWTIEDANGNRTTLIYDGFDRQSETQFPSRTAAHVSSTTDIEQFGYDANGNRKTFVTRAGQTIGYDYDALNRRIFKNVPGGTSADVYYSYDLRGRRTSAMFGLASGAGASTRGITTHYDGFGRVDWSTNASDGVARQLTYSYDANGNRLSVTYPDNVTFSYGYDGLNRLRVVCEGAAPCTAASNPIVTLGYDNRGRRASVSRAGGAVTSTYLYDPLSRLQTLSLDLDGATATNDVNFGFSYSPAAQIVTRDINNDAYAFSTSLPPLISYTSNGLNQYSSIVGTSAATPTYDSNANMTFDGSVSYSYDVENRMVSASGARVANLSYDPDGRLMTINGGAGTSSTHFLYDGDRLVGEFDSNNVTQQRYIHGQDVDEPLVAYQGGTVGAATRSFMLSNHQGSVVALANSGGSTTSVNAYSEYGVPGSANAGRFQYTGQAWLPQIGLYYYKARMYSAELGRFMQTDPIGYEDDLNLYAYVGNDPTNARDPTGTESAEIILWASCRQQGSSDCGSTPHLYAVDAFSSALPGVGAIEEYEKGNYVAAGVIGALDLGTGGKGKVVSSFLGRSVERLVGRIANRQNTINQRHIEAALREARGEVVARRPDGKPYDHIEDIRQTAAGLKSDVIKIKELIGSGKLDDASRSAAEKALSQGSRLLDTAENVLQKVENICTNGATC